LHPVPEGFVLIRPQRVKSILSTPLLSGRAKLRLLAERWRRRPAGIESPTYDDNLAHFACERFGRETFERIIEPLVAGIYTADATKLSIAATMPEAVQVLRRHGTLWHREQTEPFDSSGARYGSFVTLKNGLGSLIEKLASHLQPQDLHLKQAVAQVVRDGNQWMVITDDNTRKGLFAGVVIALPTPQAAMLLAGIDSQLALALGKIEYASSAVVTFSLRQEQLVRPLDGFGFVVPRVENRNIVAASFSSVKFPSRAPDGMALIRVFLGGALRPDLVEHSDGELEQIAFAELRKLLRINGEALAVDVVRWREKMPQYHVGHVQLVDAIEKRAKNIAGLALAGNGYRGVGIPYCVKSGDAAARTIAEASASR
jgi:protoporphyrinogen/coproporphyrinogen III oxidase